MVSSSATGRLATPRTPAWILLLFMAAAGLVSVPARAQETTVEAGRGSGAPPTVTNVFYDTPLRQVLSDISAQTGTVVVPGPDVRGIITCELQDTPLDQALDIVLAGTPFDVQKDGGFYLVYNTSADSVIFRKVSRTRRLKLNHISGSEAVSLLAPEFKKYAQGAEEENVVCVTAPPPVMERIVGDLQEMDEAPRHVLLSARVVVLEQTDLLDMGMEWDFPSAQAGAFTSDLRHGANALSPEWPWSLQVGMTEGREFTSSLMLTLDLMTQNEEARIVANPRLMSQDGEEAAISVTTDEYFEISTDNDFYQDTELEVIKSGTILNIVPRVTDENEITLHMTAEVSDVVARGENNLPVVNRRTTTNTVRVQDGGTAAVAGLMDVSDEFSERRVPFVGRLPLFGALFTKEERLRIDRQVAVFVTAQLVTPDEKSAARPAPDRLRAEPVPKDVFRQQLREALEQGNES